ncbi:MAG: YwaF family protein [Agathobacter sp.]|nr:YwaF family protein [Agathobacter sp.]
MAFFAGRGEYPAAGLFSIGHLFMLICCLAVLAILLIKTWNKKFEHPYRFIRIVSVWILILEIIKTIWGVSAGRYGHWYDYLPIWFCSLFIPFSLLAGFAKGKLREIAVSFLYYGGFVGGCTYLVFPTTSIGRYPFWHFITFHSMLYHTVMIFMAFFVIRNKLLEPSMKDRKAHVLVVVGACVLAYVVNEMLGTNYMFLAKPSNNNVMLQLALALTGPLYPVAVTLWQAYVSFFIGLWLYRFMKNHNI